MSDAQERRRFWRAAFHSPARLVTESHLLSAQLVDISLKGALLELPEGMSVPKGEKCRLHLDLAEKEGISMWSTAVHVEGRHLGLRCDSLDLDSATHLRRLVELNAGDPAILERDILALLGHS
ncbi:MAG: PilZ domain-containing protein [Rhodocyclaceae bacterium]|nr:PilZ domain-containing protein [Rhodocyclaceae bacterium]